MSVYPFKLWGWDGGKTKNFRTNKVFVLLSSTDTLPRALLQAGLTVGGTLGLRLFAWTREVVSREIEENIGFQNHCFRINDDDKVNHCESERIDVNPWNHDQNWISSSARAVSRRWPVQARGGIPVHHDQVEHPLVAAGKRSE